MLLYRTIKRKSPITGDFSYYAQLDNVNPMMLDELAQNISAHTTLTAHDVKAVVSALETQLYRYIRNGCSVRLGDLGTFYPTIKCKGTLKEQDFDPSKIKVFVRFVKSARMQRELSLVHPDVHFSRMAEKAPASPDSPSGPLGPAGPGGGGDGGSSEGHM